MADVVDFAAWTALRPARRRDDVAPSERRVLPYGVFDFELWAAWQHARSGSGERLDLTREDGYDQRADDRAQAAQPAGRHR